jgi:hypothetical protein
MHRTIKQLVIAAAFVAFAAFASLPGFSQDSGPRCALVIGNGSYTDFGKLANPVNDATDVASALKSLGFQVVLLTNASRKQMNGALNDFHDRLAQDPATAGFLWYAGHGIQAKGENYLLPVNASIQREADLEDEAVSARKITALLDDARNRLNIVVLDACRNNPIPSMGRSASRGLGVVSAAPAESLIMYSTGAGQAAADGSGRNSPFAKAFLSCLGRGGDVTATIKAVTAETKRLTKGAQVPYVYSSLTQDFALNPGAAAPGAKAASAAPAQGAEAPQAPTITFSPSYGSVLVSAATPGELYLDGQKLCDLPSGKKAKLGNIETGSRKLELRYDDGRSEARDAPVEEGRTTTVDFAYRKAEQPKPAAAYSGPAPGTPVVLTDFMSLCGFSSANKIDDVFRKIGKHTSQSDSKGMSSYTYYWEMDTQCWLTVSCDKPTKKVESVLIRASPYKSESFMAYLNGLGIMDSKIDLLGKPRSEVLRGMGAPKEKSADGRTYDYEFSLDGVTRYIEFKFSDTPDKLCEGIGYRCFN